MAIKIVDGTGGGQVCKVNSGNRLYTNAITKSTDAQINIESGKVWSVNVENQSPTAGDDYIMYIKNTGDAVLHITDIRFSSGTAATQIKVECVSGTAANGTDVTPVSRTVGSAALPTATIQVGADITGLTTGGTLFFIQCPTVDKQEHLSTSSRIRVPKGLAVGISVEASTAVITGTVSLVEETES